LWVDHFLIGFIDFEKPSQIETPKDYQFLD
jgi:hypothetical protein